MNPDQPLTSAQKAAVIKRLLEAVARLLASLRAGGPVRPRPLDAALARDLGRWRGEGLN